MPEAPKLTDPTSQPKVAGPRLDPNKPEYPTEDQMDAMFNAYKNGGQAGILELLNRLHPEKRAGEDK